MILAFTILLFTPLLSEISNCPVENLITNRSIYDIGDTLSNEDQNILFPVCNGAENYVTGDNFSFSDLNGNQIGGDYKITIISMNATW